MKPGRRIRKTAFTVTRWVGSPASIILHTLLFAASFGSVALHILPVDRMLLILTTVVSLEAIYLSIFIQMTINQTTESLEEVGEGLEELQVDLGEIQEDVGEIQDNVEELQVDVEEMSGEEMFDAERKTQQKMTLEQIHQGLQKLTQDVERLQNTPKL